MKTLSKAELIALIENTLPDDAQIVGFSSMASDFYELAHEDGSENGPLFYQFTDSDKVDMGEEFPEGATHMLETV